MPKHLPLLTAFILLCAFVPLSLAQDDARPFPDERWSFESSEAHGFVPTLETDFLTYVDDEGMDFLKSALLVHDGAIILEYYRYGVDAQTLHPTRSVTKSVVAALVGMALDDGLLPGLNVTLGESLPAWYEDDTYADTASITLQNLLMMRSGLGWSDSLQTIAQIQTEPDPIGWILSFGQVVPPDTYWNYSSADAHLAAAILQEWLGEPLADYAGRRLFAPIGITDYTWPVDQLGYNLGGADLMLTTRDMARFGYLFLNRGQWAGATIVPESWVETITTPQADPEYYGYGWWLLTEKNDGIDVWLAVGYGGQFIMVAPAYELVFVTTADWEVEPEVSEAQSDAIRDVFLNLILSSAAPLETPEATPEP